MFSINYNIKYFILFISVWYISLDIHAQKDREFWFVVPPVTEAHSAEGSCGCISNNRCGAAPASFNITNTNDVPATVTIEQPANEYDAATNPNGFQPMVIVVPANSFHREVLWGNNLCDPDIYAKRMLFENRIDPGDPTKVNKKGIRITSTEFITVYYEMEEQNNSDIYALKGENGLGDLFYVPFQKNKYNHNFGSNQPAYSSIDIVAVDGPTEIIVYPTNEVLGYGSAPFTINLEQGESVSLSPGKVNPDGSYDFYRNQADRLAGTKIEVVTPNRRIAVTISDDSVHGDSGCYDLVGDQLVPVDAVRSDGSREPIIGTEYIIMKGALGWNKGGTADYDRIYILATEDNTNVEIKDISGGGGGDVTINNMMSQEQQTYTISTENNTTHTTYIESDKPIYVLHVTGAGGGCEIGGAVIPTISACTGSFDVGFSRGTESGKDFLVNIMVREENDDDSARFAFELNGTAHPEWGDDFEKIPGSHWWTTQIDLDATIGEHSRNMISNSKEIFHLGTLNGGKSNGGNYGYFSNYSMVEGRSYVSGVGQPGIKLCYAEQVQLVADGGLEYEWLEFDDVTQTYKPGRYLSDYTAQKPYATPFSSVKYSVVVKGASCAVPDTVGVELLVADSLSSDFETDVSFGCAPLTVEIQNTSYGNTKNQWYVNDIYKTGAVQPDTFMFFNNSDTAQDYTIKLVTRNKYCIKIKEKVIRVFPEINAGFAVDDSLNCSPLIVNFSNHAAGNIDTVSGTGFRWDFDDLSTSYDREPVHLFENLGNETDTFHVEQIVTSPFLCRDTATKDIIVHPHIEGRFAFEPSQTCSPLITELKPQNSIGVDTFFWHIYDDQGYTDSLYTATNKNSIPISHNDTSQVSPDTIFVNLVVRNDQGCWDSVPERKIVVYPEVHTQFTPSDTNVCDSTLISFTNSSVGYNLKYQWDYDNGNSSDVKDPTERFFNRNNEDTVIYDVSLITWSDEYLCKDTMVKQIVVHPFVFADFTVEHQNNCTPLDISIDNSSIAPSTGTSYDWDLGDGTAYTLPNKNDIDHTLVNNSDTDNKIFTLTLDVTNGPCSSSKTSEVLVYPRVRPLFTTDIGSGCHPLDVEIINSSEPGLSFDWEFGDGTSTDTTAGSFNKIFENYSSSDTVYDIKLTASNNLGCSNDSTRTVTVYSYVEADFSLAETDTCSPFRPEIENDSEGGIVSYDWNFGNGDTDNVPYPTYIYNNTTDNVNTYELKLTVGNNHGCYDSVSREVTVYPEVVANFTTSDGLFEDCQPFFVQFDNQSNAPAIDFEWDFGDGGGSLQKNPPLHNFTNSGSVDSIYSVTLYAKSGFGCSDQITKDIIAYAYINSQFGLANSDSCSPFPLDITNMSTGGVDEYFWNFGDGTPQSNQTEPEHTYTNQSNLVQQRNVQLVVKNQHACYDTSIKQVTIYPEVVADFSTTDNIYEGCQPFSFDLLNNSNQPATYFEWDFDDGGGSLQKIPPRHTYYNSSPADSTFTIRLFAESEYGCKDEISKEITAYAYINSQFGLANSDSCSPFPLIIDNLSSGGIAQYLWDFGNGDTDVSPNPNYTYHNTSDVVRDYVIKLRVGNDHGCYDSVSRNVTVYPEVIADFTTSDGIFEDCQPFYVQFENTSNVPAVDFQWDFDDGGASAMKTPSLHNFTNNGTIDSVYSVRLFAQSEHGCSDEITKDVIAYAYIDARFGLANSDSCSPFPVGIDNLSKGGIDQYFWNFGDGSQESNQFEPAHAYRNQSDFVQERNLRLIVKNLHACYDTFIRKVTVYPEVIANFSTSDNIYAGCQPFDVNFVNNSNRPARFFIWDFDDGTNTGTDNPSKSFRNKSETDQTFRVNLFAESIYQCKDDTTIDITSYAYTEADFNVSDDDVCYGYPVEITNRSSAGTVQYDWDMDNGTIRHDEEKFQYTWMDEVDGHVFNLRLTARNSHGCYDTISKNIEIFPQVRAHIGLSDTAGCHPFYVTLTNLSENVDFTDKYFWDFGDGNDATIENPSNLFETSATEPTRYKVSLRAESEMHCWDTTSTYVTVYPKPDAMFYAQPATQFYPRSTISIDNMTNHKEEWFYDWNWGDNTLSDKKSAPSSHEYGYWGDYDVKLTVWNNYCMDSLKRTVTIFPALPIARFDSTYRGCEPLTVTFYDKSKFGTKHSWEFGDGGTYVSGPGKDFELQLQEFGEEVTHTFENDGLYNVILTVEGEGGLSQYNQIVEVYPKPEISFDVAPKVVMLPDEKIQTFNSTSVKPEFRYLWNFGDGAYSTEKEPWHLYSELGKYDVSLTMWTEHMCVDSLVKPELISVEGTGLTDFPNAFIPNLNGPNGGYYDINDPQSHVFHPYHDGVVDYHLEIYTRWGELIFVSDDVNIGWDGYINGTLAKQDVYIWRVKGTYTNGSSFVKAGDVTLLIAPEGQITNGTQ